jgi:hypothetical protein
VTANPFHVEFNRLRHRLVQIQNARGPVNLGKFDRIGNEVVFIERYGEGFFDAGEIREMQTVLLLALAGRRHLNTPLDLRGPTSKIIDASRRTHNADAYLFGLFGPHVRPIEE